MLFAMPVHPNQVTKWKKQLLDFSPEAFSSGRQQSDEQLKTELSEEIGRLKVEVELDWLRKKSGLSRWRTREWIEVGHSELSLARQCRLTGVSRSGLSYEPRGESALNLELMLPAGKSWLKSSVRPRVPSRKLT